MQIRRRYPVIETRDVSQLPIMAGHVHEIHEYFGSKIAQEEGKEKHADVTYEFVRKAVENQDCFLTKSNHNNSVVALVLLPHKGGVFTPRVWFVDGKEADRGCVMGTYAAVKTLLFEYCDFKQILFVLKGNDMVYRWASCSILGPDVAITVNKTKEKGTIVCYKR